MSVGWQKVRIPLMERLALLDLAERQEASEEAVLVALIRQAVKAELVAEQAAPTAQAPVDQAADDSAA